MVMYILFTSDGVGVGVLIRAELLEAWLALTQVKYHGNL